MHEVLVNRLGGLSLPRKSVVRLTDRPHMTLDVYRGRKTTIQLQYKYNYFFGISFEMIMVKYISIRSTSIKEVIDVNKCLAYSHEI